MIKSKKLYSNFNEGIIDKKYKSFERNLELNIESIKKYGGLKRIIPFFNNKNIIIIGAGTSLDLNIKILKKYYQNPAFLTIATDMALRPLSIYEIIPDYAISCETRIMDFFSGLSFKNNPHLISFSCISNSNLRKWNGDISFYNWTMDTPEYNKLWNRAGSNLGGLASGNIVTTNAISLAIGAGAKSIILIGNDLGFVDRFYCKESISSYKNSLKTNRYNINSGIEMDISRRNRKYQISRADKIYYTNNQFYAAKLWLEEFFSKHQIPVFDASIPGCSDEFVNKIDLNNFFSKTIKSSRNKKRKR
jgi:hypothetical protein